MQNVATIQRRHLGRAALVYIAVLCGALLASACAATPTEPVESATDEPANDLAEAPDDLAYAETPASESVVPPETALPTETPEPAPVEPAAVEPEPVEPAPAEPEASGPPLCLALVPEDPGPDATGVVTYTLQGEWAQYSYGALYVIDASGKSAFPSGEPAVRNGDSFTFVIDDSMRAADGSWTITTSIGGELEEPCDYRTTPQASIAAASNGSVGY